MNLKEELLKLRKKLEVFNKYENNSSEVYTYNRLQIEKTSGEDYDFENLPLRKMKDFLSWYATVLPKFDNNVKVEKEIKSIQNFIEKVAVYYELKYPDFIIEGSNTKFMTEFDDGEVYNIKTFIDNLPDKEKTYFLKPCYHYKYIFVDGRHFEINKNGEILKFCGTEQDKIKNHMLKGKNIKEGVQLLKDEAVVPDVNYLIDNQIKVYEIERTRRKQMLNVIMYRIIERGSDYSKGARRALIFAKDFDLSLFVPLVYEVTLANDPYLNSFLEEYVSSGGSKEAITNVLTPMLSEDESKRIRQEFAGIIAKEKVKTISTKKDK